MRCSRGIPGASRIASTHTLTAMKCTGTMSCHARVLSRFTSGSSATTMGRSRTLDRHTASVPSSAPAPDPSAVARITCAGPAQINTVESIPQKTDSP